MVKINGKLVHAAAIGNQSNGQNLKQRQAMLEELKAKQMAKMQRVADLQQLKSTFQTTDLGQTEKKPALVEDTLAQEIE